MDDEGSGGLVSGLWVDNEPGDEVTIHQDSISTTAVPRGAERGPELLMSWSHAAACISIPRCHILVNVTESQSC